MVKKRQTKRQRDIKTKLMAAICMLLVSSIMMVSTTYAWFTLSTAPEVTGIQTAVGANGNLEMALVPTSGVLNDIKSETGDSTKAINERNITWGNLVDVSNNTYYGMDQITLYPSQLRSDATKDADGNITFLPSGALLETPSYGADGRIAEMTKDAQTGIYQTIAGTTAFFPDSGATNYGVRAVGTASGLSARALSYRNARAAANDARGLAANKAAKSLSSNGNSLAGIAVKLAAGSDATYAKADLLVMGKIITDLTEEGGVLDQIEISYIQYLLALAASSATGDTDFAWTTVKAAVEAEGATLDSVLAALTGVELPTALTTGINAYKATVATVAQAEAEYQTQLAKNQETYTWTELSPILEKLADPNKMLINNKTVDSIKENKQPLIDDVMGGLGITVTIASGGGVYADVADHCGDYTSSVKIENIEFQGVTINTNATMNTKSGLPVAYLVALRTAVEGFGAPTSTSEALPMTDIFGYIIDLAFRTNAADSNLLLQADAVDRIYQNSTGAEIKNEDGTIESTMGHGASMTFQSTNATFSEAQVKNLMGSIRIVFFDPTTLEVYATAKLDVANATSGTDGVTAKMYLYELTAGGGYIEAKYDATVTGETYYTKTVTYEELTEDEAAAANFQLYIENADQTGYVPTAYDANATQTYYEQIVTYNKHDDPANAGEGVQLYVVQKAGEVRLDDMKIMSLTQNTATALSVLVYLDGNDVTNADVAATGSSSMKGTMNLQFSSSATLTPMEYTPLMGQEKETEPATP